MACPPPATLQLRRPPPPRSRQGTSQSPRSDFFYFAHRPNSERDLALPHPDTEVTAEHFDKFARNAVATFERCVAAPAGSVADCAFALRTHTKYHGGQVRLAMGCYAPFVAEYLAQFDRQLVVLTLEEYKADPRAALGRVFEHLGVSDPDDQAWTKILGKKKVTNQQGEHYKSLRMLNGTREALTRFYARCGTPSKGSGGGRRQRLVAGASTEGAGGGVPPVIGATPTLPGCSEIGGLSGGTKAGRRCRRVRHRGQIATCGRVAIDDCMPSCPRGRCRPGEAKGAVKRKTGGVA